MSTLLKRFFKYIFVTLTSLVLLATVFVGFFLVQLYRGPINLDFLKSHLAEKVLHQADTLEFETLQLAWDDLNAPIRLEGLGIHYRQGKEKHREISLKKGQLYFPLHSLLKFKFIPEKVIIEGMKLSIHSFKGDVGDDQYKADLNFKKVNNFIEDLLDLQAVHISNSSLVIDAQSHPITLDISAQITNIKGTLKGRIIAQNQNNPGKIQSTLFYEKGADSIDITLQVEGFDSKTFDDVVPEIFLQDLTFQNIFFRGHYRYFPKSKKHEAQLNGSIKNVDVSHSAYWKAPLKFPELSFEGALSGNDFQLKEVATSVQGIPIKANTTGHIDEKSDRISFETHVNVVNIPFKDLGNIWPKGAADGAREWITENITGGTASKADLVMKSHLDFSGRSSFFNLDKLSGTIDVHKALLGYVETMPKINNLMATATFDHEHFDIKIKSGETHGLKITSGDLFIGNFSDDTPHLTLNVVIVGDLGNVLSLIDHKPLEYAKDYGLDPKTARGQTEAKLKMTFPLSSPFRTEDIQTKVTAQVTDARLDDLAGLDIDLFKGDLTIDVGLKDVAVEGTALLNGEKSHLHLVKNVETQHLDLKVKTDVTPKALNKLWHDAGMFFQGIASLELHYHVDGKKEGTLSLDFNLKDAELNTLVMKKKRGISGTLSVKGRYQQGHLTHLNSLHFQDNEGWKINGKGHFSPKTDTLKDLNLEWIHKGQSIVSAYYIPDRNGVRVLDLKGQRVDLKNFMDTDLSDLSNPNHMKKYPQDETPLQIQFTAQKITVGKEIGLLNNVLKMRLEKGLIHTLSYKGLTEEATGKNRDVYAEIYQKKNGLRKLRIQTEQGGAFLRALDIFENIRGGQFKLVAYHDPAFRQEEWVGKIRVRHFVLLNAPLITRIFSLFPTAGTELTSDAGMKFRLMKVRFGASPKAFKIHGSRAHGISIGFNLNGEIERGPQGRLNLQGNMIPLYVLNTLVSKIPLIGEVIAGGKNEGLFSVSFGVTGTKDNPNVIANPLSIITPGITRNIFPSAESSLTRDDGWIDEADDSNDIFDQEFNDK